MSSIAPSARLGWRLLPGVIAAAVAIVGAGLMIQALRAHPIVVAGPGQPASAANTVADGVPWRTDARPVGAGRKLTKTERARFGVQKDRVRKTVRDLADAIAMHPTSNLSQSARRLMTGAAAGSLLKQVPAMPKGAEAVAIVERAGRIGVQSPRFAAAVAQLHVVTRATINDRVIKWRDDYRFWLQRDNKKWRVISFELDRAQR